MALVMAMVLVMVLLDLGLVDLVLVAAGLAVVEMMELVLVAAGLAVVVMMDSLSPTVASNSVPFTPSSTSVCSTSVSMCSSSSVSLISSLCSSSSVGVAGVDLETGRGVEAAVLGEVVDTDPVTGNGVGAAVPGEVVDPDPVTGDGVGAAVPREVVGPDPDALLSTCFFLGNTKVPSNCERTLDNSDWLKYEPVKWTLATTMRMAVFISATC